MNTPTFMATFAAFGVRRLDAALFVRGLTRAPTGLVSRVGEKRSQATALQSASRERQQAC